MAQFREVMSFAVQGLSGMATCWSRPSRTFMVSTALALASVALPGHAQVQTLVPTPVAGAKPATVERIKVHSIAIEGNLEGESADRDVVVILPPSYGKEPSRRYPVVYALHGYSIGAEQWMKEIHVPQTVEGAFAEGAAEMIVVLPDSKTAYNGSMYSSSQTTGDFETFVSRDLVGYVDSHYRTLRDRRSRGLVGHSMGGYGATRIGLKHADVFGALYLMSPCCLSVRDPQSFEPDLEAKVAQLRMPADSEDLSFGPRGALAMAAAWSPNPRNPPLYLDLPVKDGTARPEIIAKWMTNSPLAFADQYIDNLRKYAAIAMDVGDQDGLKVDTRKLHALFDSYGIANSLEIYPGTHTSAVANRFQNHVMPFFSAHLAH